MRLREPRLDDSYQTVEWLNDPDITVFMNKGQWPMTVEMQEAYRNDGKKVYVAFEDDQGTHVGNGTISNIDFIHRSAEIGILIGKAYWRMDFGTKGWAMLTEHAFNELNLTRLYAWIMEGNEGSARVATKCGFTYLFSVPKMFYRHGAWLKGMYFNKERV